MKSKPVTRKELLALVEGKLLALRAGSLAHELQRITNPQEREMAQWTLGQITALDEVRSLLLGLRRSFV